MISLIQNKRKIFIVVAVVLFAAVALGVYSYFFRKPSQIVQNPPENQITHPPCLEDDKIADFPTNEYYSGEHFKYPKFPVVIYVRDKNTNKEKFKFQIDNVRENYYPIELHKCGVYVIRELNYDSKKTKQDPGYRSELWKYTYNGKGEFLLLLHEVTNQGEYKSYFATDFRIDPQEVYVALERGYPGANDYALVVRNLDTKIDAFVLLRKTLSEKYSINSGYFRLQEWTRDGNYFWASLSMTSVVEVFLRILRDIWEFDVLPAPEGTMGGTALNSELGYITYDDGAPWSGDADIDEMYRQQWKEEGKKVHFYLYNLLTKKQILLATIDDPTWNFKPKWISDTELEYELPTGEKKIYQINDDNLN